MSWSSYPLKLSSSIITIAFIDATSSTGQLLASYPFWRAFDAVTDLPSPARCTQTLSIGVPDRPVSVSSASESAIEGTNGQKSRRSPLQTLYDGDQVSLPWNASWASLPSSGHLVSILVLAASWGLELHSGPPPSALIGE